MAKMTFNQRFDRAFADGLADIGFTVIPGSTVTPSLLKSEALRFQEAIDNGRFTEVLGVD